RRAPASGAGATARAPARSWRAAWRWRRWPRGGRCPTLPPLPPRTPPPRRCRGRRARGAAPRFLPPPGAGGRTPRPPSSPRRGCPRLGRRGRPPRPPRPAPPPAEGRGAPPPPPPVHRGEELAAVGEVLVDERATDASALGDRFHRHGGHVPRRDDLDGGIQQGVAPLTSCEPRRFHDLGLDPPCDRLRHGDILSPSW